MKNVVGCLALSFSVIACATASLQHPPVVVSEDHTAATQISGVPPVDMTSKLAEEADIRAFVAWAEGPVVSSSTSAEDLASVQHDRAQVDKIIAMIDRGDPKEIFGFVEETRGEVDLVSRWHEGFWTATVFVATVFSKFPDRESRVQSLGEFLVDKPPVVRNLMFAAVYYLLGRDPDRVMKYKEREVDK